MDAVHFAITKEWTTQSTVYHSPYEALPQREVGLNAKEKKKNCQEILSIFAIAKERCRASSSMETWSVYILLCSDGKPYTGCTSDFEKRLIAHHAGKVKSTQLRLPVRVILKLIF